MISGAYISPCERYRYALWRIWDDAKPEVVFVMLNPSTADAVVNDPTIERCMSRAQNMGYGALRVVNLFALRATKPEALYSAPDPIGPENDAVIVEATSNAGIVVCGWGAHGGYRGRDAAVLSLLRVHGAVPHCLGTTKGGHPRHPLYVAYSVAPSVLP